jgi:phage portal protein BeeE
MSRRRRGQKQARRQQLVPVTQSSEVMVLKDRQALPTKVDAGTSAVAWTWDGRVPIQNAKVYKHWAKTSEWVRGAIFIRKTQVSSAEWDIVPYDQRKPWSKRQAQAIKRMFQTPNPQNDSYRTFIEPIIEDLLTLDAGCVEKVRNLTGELVEMWPVNAEWVRVNAMWEGDPRSARYFWYPDGYREKARWRNDDFVYMMANPRTDSPVGLPPLETLRAAVEAELAAHEYNRRQVENAAPDGIINLGEGFTEKQVDRFREYFESEVAGRGPLGFLGGTKDPGFIKFRDSNRDQQFLEWQIYLVRKIAVVYGVTPQDLGVTFDVNRSTSEIQLQVSEDRGLRPLMSLIQEYLTEEVVWDDSFGGPDNNLAFRFTALNLKESTAKAAILEKALAGVPWRTINEARIEEGREQIEGGDRLIMETPQGALDISDVPTVREFLEMQQAKAAPSSSEKNFDVIADVAARILTQWSPAQPREVSPPEIHTHIDKGALAVSVDHYDETSSDAIRSATEELRDAVVELKNAPPPVVNVAPPVVNVSAPEVNVETESFTDAINAFREELVKAPPAPTAPPPVVRREVKRDADGRITEVIDHRGE